MMRERVAATDSFDCSGAVVCAGPRRAGMIDRRFPNARCER